MRVLVTGGAGFIGSHMVDALMAKGHAVTVLDNLSTGNRDNLRTHLDDKNFRFVRGDIRDRETVRRAFSGVDAVVHAAALVSVPLSMENPELARDVNVRGTLSMLKAARDGWIKRFVFASSCAVYGGQAKLPVKEDASPRPLSPYASSKLEAERACHGFHERHGLETVCMRYFNVYGPRQGGGEYAGVIVRFIERLRTGQPPVIYGDGGQTRDFIYVGDVVDATLRALGRRGVAGGTFNIGSGKATSVNRLCRVFMKVAGRTDLEPVHRAARRGEVRHSRADISRAKKSLGFRPRVPLERGVKLLWKRGV